MPPPRPRAPQLTAVLRQGEERVTPLELFFDLVFVLAITQCTALMAAEPTWAGLGKGLVVLGVLWWAWVGYAWLTSVVDPEEGSVRFVIFGAIATMLVVSLAVPHAFGDDALLLAIAYMGVRLAQIGLFLLASRGDPELRRSVWGLLGSTLVGTCLLLAAAFTDGAVQGAMWVIALTLDLLGPYFFGADGWKLVPGHFAERHGLIVLIALGESIVAIGVGANAVIDAGIVVAAVVGVGVTAALWWLYFDVVALVAARRLEHAPPGREQNEIARDSYSYLHFPMVAGIVLVALGFKKTLGHVGDPLHVEPAVALLGGTALYLLAHVGFRLRNVRTLSRPRLTAAVVCIAFVPVAVAVPALVAISLLLAVLWGLVAFEVTRYREARARLRRELGGAHPRAVDVPE